MNKTKAYQDFSSEYSFTSPFIQLNNLVDVKRIVQPIRHVTGTFKIKKSLGEEFKKDIEKRLGRGNRFGASLLFFLLAFVLFITYYLNYEKTNPKIKKIYSRYQSQILQN